MGGLTSRRWRHLCSHKRCSTSVIASCKSRDFPGSAQNLIENHSYDVSRYHPFLLKTKLKDFPNQTPNHFLLRSFETGYEHAKQLILQIDAAKAAGCRAEIAFYSYAAALAGSILIFYIYDTSESARFEVDSLQRKNIAFLEELGQRWNHTPTAVRTFPELLLFVICVGLVFVFMC
jgi:hypothetical protein